MGCKFFLGIRSNDFAHVLEDVLMWWGQKDPRVKKLDDLMPINVTVTNTGKIALPESVKKC